MDNYLIDRETLSKFVDELIKNKALPVSTTEELNAKREELIKSLDRQIGTAIFGQFTDEQNDEFNQLLDQDEEITESTYQDFFDKTGINVEETITATMKKFAQDFLKGDQNE